jgi:hypothetical protein
VRKVKFKLADKRAALMDIAKLFGWITERRDNKIVDEFDTMSEEQIDLDGFGRRRGLADIAGRCGFGLGRDGLFDYLEVRERTKLASQPPCNVGDPARVVDDPLPAAAGAGELVHISNSYRKKGVSSPVCARPPS